MATRYGGKSAVDPETLRAECIDQKLPLDWWGKANLFRNPLGRGPGTGGVLLTLADLYNLTLTAAADLVFEDDRTTPSRPVTLKTITLLRARCVSPGHRDDLQAAYLCELVDRRHFLAQVPLDRAYNVRDADGTGYLSATDNAGTAWTWAEVLDDIWGELDAGTVPTLPFTPDGTPENLRYHAGWAWEALNDVLDRLACTVELDHVTDTFTFVRLGDTTATGATTLTAALAAHDAAGLRTWDAYHVEPFRGRLPETVRVLFQLRPVPTDGSSPWVAEDVTLTATAGVEPGTFVQLHDDLAATGSNGAALTTRAAERAADWRRKRVGFEKRTTLVYRDFRADLAPGETVARAGLDDRGGVMSTVLESEPDGAMERWRPWVPPVGADLTSTSGCRAKLAGLRTNECLTFLVLPFGDTDWDGAAETGGGYDTDSGGWVADETVVTGDGDTEIVIFRKADGGMGVKAVGETTTWYGVDLGCAGEYGEFAIPYCPPDAVDEGGSGSGESEECAALADCEDHTIRVRVKCGPCVITATMDCTPAIPPFTIPRTMQFSCTYIGGGTGYDYVGTIVYMGPSFDVDCYYNGSAYVAVTNLWQATIPNPDPATVGSQPNITINFQLGNSELKAWVGNCEYCGSSCSVFIGCAGFIAPEFTASPFKLDVTDGDYRYVVE